MSHSARKNERRGGQSSTRQLHWHRCKIYLNMRQTPKLNIWFWPALNCCHFYHPSQSPTDQRVSTDAGTTTLRLESGVPGAAQVQSLHWRDQSRVIHSNLNFRNFISIEKQVTLGSRIRTAILLEKLPERLRTLHFALQQTRLRGAEQQPAAQINDILPAALSFDLWISVVGHGFHLRTDQFPS